jgi:uncharacterized integral membrane protein
MRIIKFIFGGIVACILLVFSLQNRHMVKFQWNPFVDSQLADAGIVELPMFLCIIITMIAGIIVGITLEWLRESKHRSEARTQKAEVGKLRGEINRLYSERSQ